MKFPTLLLLALASSVTLSAQVRLGFRAGLVNLNVPTSANTIPGGGSSPELLLDVDEAQFGIQGGLVVQIPIGDKWIIQPEVIFNSNRVDYEVEELRGSGTVTKVLSEKYQYLDIPLLLHYRIGALRLCGGPLGHIYVNSTSDLLAYENYDQRFEELTYGYQLGVGLDIWNIMLDVRYQGNFTRFGDHMYFNEERYDFDQRPERLIFSLGLLLGK
ncbi:MAG: porin family protein [Phaeodactylibacter sp.]|uniref:porin family protein n=1 Tax=Phaeodactylibacter sp. TaxID=1940289 RepID=UPI0032EC6045